MTPEERAIQVLEQADPMLVLAQDRQRDAAGEYLTTIQKRSSPMQTVEKPEKQDKDTNSGRARWLMAAIVIAVVATAGVLILTSQSDDAPVVTSPEVEEPEPVATSAPEAVEKAEPEETVPEANPSTEPELPEGTTGLPLWAGQTEPGDYEVLTDNLHFVFSSDGEWSADVPAYEGECQMIRACPGVKGAFHVQSNLAEGDLGLVDSTLASTEGIRERFESIPGLVVGENTPFEPTNPEAGWTGEMFLITPEADAPMDPICTLMGTELTYPCVLVDWIGERYEGIDQAITGPTRVYVMTAPDNQRYFATVIWRPSPRPPEGHHEFADEHFQSLLQTIRFLD